MKLTDKQEEFCQQYLIDLNATQAAIRAGYSEKTANQVGPENLVKLGIQERIAELKAIRSERTAITQDKVLREFARLGFADIKDVAEFGENGVMIKASKDLPKDASATISEVTSTTMEGDGWSKTTTKIKQHSKVSALENLAKHLGLYAPKKIDLTTAPPTLKLPDGTEYDL